MPLLALFRGRKAGVLSPTHEEMARSRYKRSYAVPSAGQTHIYSTSGMFSNANNTVFTGPVQMYDINQSDHSATIQRLAEKEKPEAMHNSSFRQYTEKCSENTRVSIRQDIVKWRDNPNRQSRLCWYMGSAAIGKSATAESVAEELDEIGLLGATFFFSRPGQIDDPDTVVPTLAYQLAMMNDLYKRIVTKLLVADPLLLTKNRDIQFKKLIVEPFQMIMASDSSAVDNPLLIILDGLDECKGCTAQCELIQLVLDHIRGTSKVWHLMLISPPSSEKKEISVDDEEAIIDTRCLLGDELISVRKQYTYLPSDWPARKDVDRLCKAASGHLGYMAFMTRFFGDKEVADPERRFSICVKVASGLGVDQGTRINPLKALDLLYHRVISNVSADMLPTAMKIFGVICHAPSTILTCRDLAGFLLLTKGQLYQGLGKLHAVVYVPPPNTASSRPLRFFHASFSDFMLDHTRSGEFHLSRKILRYDLILQSLRWLGTRH
ncbi:hypothetical protein NP233_g8083 [Leucocoprinus birnbaumii]|uniref:Nephrocystin 3-like N-terminal domain-containing protein n=1 Tax=Leucocoprinus birnbaumii TaxID=56174 RepID=A0AAD5VPK3_9AGAR|nr:hypothetical protein NP233_g8083 [Leucocoprinus birnbaumii]